MWCIEMNGDGDIVIRGTGRELVGIVTDPK